MIALLTIVFSAVFGILLPLTSPAITADLVQGGRVFASNCAACHVGGGNAIIFSKTLKQDALEQYLEGFGTEHAVEAIVYQVTKGKNAMPAFKGRLTDDQVADVAAYVKSQSEKGW
ncbi:MAG: c-type cytochrome [Phormidesmis sp.]